MGQVTHVENEDRPADITVAEFERLLVGRWPKGEHYYHVVYRQGTWRLTVFLSSPIEGVAGLKATTLTELAEKLASGEGD